MTSFPDEWTRANPGEQNGDFMVGSSASAPKMPWKSLIRKPQFHGDFLAPKIPSPQNKIWSQFDVLFISFYRGLSDKSPTSAMVLGVLNIKVLGLLQFAQEFLKTIKGKASIWWPEKSGDEDISKPESLDIHLFGQTRHVLIVQFSRNSR